MDGCNILPVVRTVPKQMESCRVSLWSFSNVCLLFRYHLTRGEACGIPFKATNSHTWTSTKFRLVFENKRLLCVVFPHTNLIVTQKTLTQTCTLFILHDAFINPIFTCKIWANRPRLSQCKSLSLLQVSQVRNLRNSNAVFSAQQFSRRRPLSHI